MSYKKSLSVIVIVVIFVLGVMLASSYAYYVFSGASTTFNTNTYNENISVTYNSSKYINTTSAIPISSDQVDSLAASNSFSVSIVGGDEGTTEVLVSISLTNISIDTLKNADFKYQLIRGSVSNGEIIASGTGLDFTGSTFELASKEKITSTTDYVFRVWIDKTGLDQNALSNSTFSASIDVNAVKIRH